MTIALDNLKSYNDPLSSLSCFIRVMRRDLNRLWNTYRQVAILRHVNPDTLADIGFSYDYIRPDWQDFAADHPAIVAPATKYSGKP